MRHRTVEEGHTVEKMDTVDSLTRKLISSFEHLEDYLLLEQLAVPEDLWDLEGSVELWVASTHAYGSQEDIVVRCHISVPTSVVLERNARELAQLFKDELLARSTSGTLPPSQAWPARLPIRAVSLPPRRHS
jgi:hypothetical protein